MKKEDLFRTIGSVEDQQILEAEAPKAHRRLWPRAAALAACLALLVVAAAALPQHSDSTASIGQGASALDGSDDSVSGDRPGNMIHSPDYTGGTIYSVNVDIGQLHTLPPESPVAGDSSACLVWLEPEEIFAMDTLIFRGVVQDLQYYEVTGGYRGYFTVAAVEVTDVLRGDLDAGDIYNIYLPILKGQASNSTAGDLESLEVGSEAIFMPYAATADTGITSGDAYFCYADVAECWFDEGVRFLFLQTEEGLRYASDVYDLGVDPSEATLDDAAAYIRSMLAPQENQEGALSSFEAAEALPPNGEATQSAEPQAARGDAGQAPVDGETVVDTGEWRPKAAWGQELPNAEPRWDDSGVIAARQAESGGLCGLPRAEDFSPNPADFQD